MLYPISQLVNEIRMKSNLPSPLKYRIVPTILTVVKQSAVSLKYWMLHWTGYITSYMQKFTELNAEQIKDSS